MPTFYCTFGQKYYDEAHPQGGHPDGWFEIEAPDHSTAYALAHREFGEKFCSVYSEEFFNKTRHYYQLGRLGVINPDGMLATEEEKI